MRVSMDKALAKHKHSLHGYCSKEGFLEKKVKNVFKGFAQRYVKLNNRELTYYKPGKKGQLERAGLLNFDIY